MFHITQNFNAICIENNMTNKGFPVQLVYFQIYYKHILKREQGLFLRIYAYELVTFWPKRQPYWMNKQ